MRSVRALLAAAFVSRRDRGRRRAAAACGVFAARARRGVRAAADLRPPRRASRSASSAHRIPMPRTVFGTRDLLIVERRDRRRRPARPAVFRPARESLRPRRDRRAGGRSRTGGWIRIVAVNESTAIATFEHLCADIVAGRLPRAVRRAGRAGRRRSRRSAGRARFHVDGARGVRQRESQRHGGRGLHADRSRERRRAWCRAAALPCIATSASPACRSPASARRSSSRPARRCR